MRLEIMVSYGKGAERSFCINSETGIVLLLETLEEMTSDGFMFIDKINEKDEEKKEVIQTERISSPSGI